MNLIEQIEKISSISLDDYIMKHIATTGLTGITGTGKTSLLTDYCRNVAELGGKVFTLPGYDLYTDKSHTVKLSIQLTMPQLVKLLNKEETAKELYHSVVAIDQIESKLNHHRWQGVLPALYENFADQRRKLRAGIVYTMQIWRELIPPIRMRTFFLYELFDWSFGNPDMPMGESADLIFTDVLGTKTGIEMNQIQYPFVFHPGGSWPFYDTNQWTNPLDQFRKMKIISEPEVIDMDNLDGVVTETKETKVKIPMLGGRYFECLADKPMSINEIAQKYRVPNERLKALAFEAQKAGILTIKDMPKGKKVLTLCTA